MLAGKINCIYVCVRVICRKKLNRDHDFHDFHDFEGENTGKGITTTV